MIANLNKNLDFWRDFNLIGLQKDLDNDASEIAIRQDESELNRKKLVDLSREFKKNTPEELRKLVAPLLKSFQGEIDTLNRRSKSAESSFLTCYGRVTQMPDPTPVLEHACSLHKDHLRLLELEQVNLQLNTRLNDYNNEVAEVKNQEVTVKQLRERVKELEDRMDQNAQARADEKGREMERAYGEKEKEWVVRQTHLAKRLGEAEHRSTSFQQALNSLQSELFESRGRNDENIAAKADEIDLLVADLERANERALIAERQLEQRKTGSTDKETTEHLQQHTSSQQAIDLLRRTSMQVELASKEKEISQLVADVQQLQQLVNKLRSSGSSHVARLEEELKAKLECCCLLEAKLNSQADYEDITRELSVLKSMEFSYLSDNNNTDTATNNDTTTTNNDTTTTKSLERLLMEKNRALQTENTTIKCSITQLTEKVESLGEELKRTSVTCQEQHHLIGQLEDDLRRVNALSIMFRGDAEGEAGSSKQTADLMAGLVSSKEDRAVSEDTLRSATNGLLPIVQNQRERFRIRAQELEATTMQQQQEMSLLRNEMDMVRSDNVKLYQKVKFLQGYSQNKTPTTGNTDDTDSRYSNEYNRRLDPFQSFNRSERLKHYVGLKPYDKITLGMGRFIMSSKTARTMVFFYSLFLHVFVFLMLYKLAYTASCQRDNVAEDWHQKFNDHMASHHPGDDHHHH